MNWITACFTAGSLCLACSVSYGFTSLQYVSTGTATTGSTTHEAILCMALMALSAVLFDVARLQPSRYHTLKSLFSQYIYFKTLPFLAFWRRCQLKTAIDEIEQTQEEILLNIIRHNGWTKYGRDHKFNEIHRVEDFRTKQSLTDYSDYEAYVTDILNGQDNILIPEKVDFIATTSGTTTGKSKLFPKCLKSQTQHFKDIRSETRYRIISSSDTNHLKFWHRVMVIPPKPRFQSCIPQNAAASFTSSNAQFQASPPAVSKVCTEPEALYLHALFGIRNDEIIIFEFLTSPMVLNFIHTIENNWENLCTDLENGKLNQNIKIDAGHRSQIEQELYKDIHRAQHLRGLFKEGFHDLIPRIWPSCKFIMTAISGSYSFATEILKRNYLGGVRVNSSTHLATEGTYGTNLGLMTSDECYFTIIPSLNFYEFVPIKDTDRLVGQTVLANEVEVGEEYELVVTTRSGLYRYRTQDIVRITGFQRQSPSYMLVQRAGDVLSASTDKYPEKLFSEAIKAAAETWTSCSLLNYIATENIHVESILGGAAGTCCYYIFIELMQDGRKLSQKEKAQVDQSLMDYLERYRDFRMDRRSLAPPVVIQIECGSVQHVRDIVIRDNPYAAASQYKYPHFIRKQAVLKYLLSHQV